MEEDNFDDDPFAQEFMVHVAEEETNSNQESKNNYKICFFGK